MRVIAGSARRLLLEAPRGMDTRPTQDIIKETLFNMLQPLLYDCSFLDLFAGSGAIGIEALSRGAREACFSDFSKEAVKCIKNNLEHTHFTEEGKVYAMDYTAALRQMEFDGKHFDVVYLDPPYGKGLEIQALTILANSKMIDGDTTIVVETSLETDPSEYEALGFRMKKDKTYKTNRHVFLEKA